MKVYSLLGFVDYEGQDLLGVFGSLEDLKQFVESKRSEYEKKGWSHKLVRLGFDDLGYVESELGKSVDVLGEVEYL